MSYRIHAVIQNKETGEKSSYQIFGNHDFPKSFREWMESKGIEIHEDGYFGVTYVPDKYSDWGELHETPVEVDPIELLEAVCKVSEEEYLRLREEGKDPFAMPYYAYPGHEPKGYETSFGQAMMDLTSETYVFNWMDFLRWGQQEGLYSYSSWYPPQCTFGWEKKYSISIIGY